MTFIVFFIIVLALHNMPFPWRMKKFNLLVASYLFYAAWNPPFVALLAFTTAVDLNVARLMARTESRLRRKLLLLVSLSSGLGLLGFFKYGAFVLENFIALLHLAGIEYHPAAPDIVLPVGISFYTFQTLSYTIDVYRGNIKPSKSFLDFAFFVSFFPQLVAGPIVRASDFLPQCIEPKRASARQLGWGLTLMVIGLFEKTIFADTILAPVTEAVYSEWRQAGFGDAWIGIFAFAGQVYFDFAGYSTIAIGVGLCLGFALPDNFHAPFAAVGFSDLWRRWHISLSSWLRDYLYRSLGGNRKGRIRTFVNAMLTMLLGGLWHGAAWGYVIWGAFHGVFLVAERLLQMRIGHWRIWQRTFVRFLLAQLTFLGFCIALVFFRSPSPRAAVFLLGKMFSGSAGTLVLTPNRAIAAWLLIAGIVLAHWFCRNTTLEDLIGRRPAWVRALLIAALLVALALSPGDDRAFVYFQF